MNTVNHIEHVSRRLARLETRLVKLADSLGVNVCELTPIEFKKSDEQDIAAVAHVASPTSSLYALITACKNRNLTGTVEVRIKGEHVADLYI